MLLVHAVADVNALWNGGATPLHWGEAGCRAGAVAEWRGGWRA